MGIFNFLQKKASRTFQAILFAHPEDSQVFGEKEYEDIARDGYKKNAIVRSAVDLVADSFAEIEPKLYRKGPDGLETVSEHPILDLLDKPNPLQSPFEWRKTVVSYLLLGGDSYLQGVGPTGGPNAGIPRELWPLRPDRMEIVAGNWRDPIKGYVYTANGQEIPVDAEKVMHVRMFSPLDDWYGLSPLKSAGLAIDSHNESSEWNIHLMNNGGVPPFIVNIKGNVSNDVREDFANKVLLNSKKNANKPLVLEGADGVTVEKLAHDAKSLQRLDGLKMDAREIVAVLKVPPQLVGIPDAETFSNYETARKALYTEAVIPIANQVYSALSYWIMPKFGEDPSELFFKFNTAEIDALQEEKSKLYKRVTIAWNAGLLTQRQAVKMLGVDDAEAEDDYKYNIVSSLEPGTSGTDALDPENL